MKRRLELLIRIQKQVLDESRKRLIQLELQMYEQIQQLKQLNAEVTKEKQFTASHIQYSHTWRDYLKTAQLRENNILRFIDQLNRNIVWEKQNIQRIFKNLKAYEIAKDNLINLEQLEINKAEQYALDEIAINQYVRKDL